jgi:hypothetical protein
MTEYRTIPLGTFVVPTAEEMRRAKQQYDSDMAEVEADRTFTHIKCTRFGNDTSDFAMSFYLSNLAQNTEKMNKVQAEYERAIGVRPL